MSVAPSNFPITAFPLDMYPSIPCIVLACPVSLFLATSLSPHLLYLFPIPNSCVLLTSVDPQPQQHLVLPPKHSQHTTMHFPTSQCLFHFHALAWDPTQAYASCIDIKHTYRHCFSASVPSQAQHTPDPHHSAFSFTRRLRGPSRRAARSIWHSPWPPQSLGYHGASRCPNPSLDHLPSFNRPCRMPSISWRTYSDSPTRSR